MTDRATLEALLARVLEGEGPDRELDGEIALTLGGWERKWCANELPSGWYWRRGVFSWTAEGDGYPSNYSASLDAALTLVPEGWRWWVNSSGYARLWLPGKDGQAPQAIAYCEHRATPPRALIAASLKARMEAQGE